MSPRPSRSTLFPYTTLFRSGVDHPPGGELSGGGCDRLAELDRRLLIRLLLDRSPAGADDRPGDAAAVAKLGVRRIGDRVDLEDRKSTRLNSSHQIISYAVFC